MEFGSAQLLKSVPLSALKDLSDEDLIERFQETRDNALFSEIFRRHSRSIFACCLNVLGDPTAAEDLTQETFVTAYTRIELYRRAAFHAWLCPIAKNLCLNYLKSRLITGQADRIEAGRARGPGPNSPNRTGLADEIRIILDQLPPQQRISLKLFHMEGYSYREIERATGYSGKDVKSYLQNGKRRFRLAWERLQRAESKSNKATEHLRGVSGEK